jgi:single-stranded-DNA-specific exonuclease
MQVNELYRNEPITIKSYLEKCGVKDTEEYLDPTGKYIDSWKEYKGLESVCQELEYWSKTEETIFIIQDGDVDGICSTSILYQYLIKFSDTWDIKILIHSGKQRGLDDEDIMNRIHKDCPVLVIIPDAGSNNYVQAEELCKMGVGLIVLDHHDIDTPIKSGTLISNQRKDCNVSRNGSGTLVTHKLLQAMDKLYNHNWSGDYIDLVALSLLSDSMDMTEMENREYYYFGLETRDCVNNEFLGAMIDRFISNDTYTQRDLGFKIIPKLNSVCRCNDIGLKQQLILAFIGQCDIDEALDMIEQAHQNQIKIVDDVIQNNMDKILSCGQNNLIVFASNDVPRSYSGLLAGKIKTLCDNKPTIVGSIKGDTMIGSLRSPIPLREELDNNKLVDFASGHDCSCGIGIQVDNIQALVDYYNTLELSYTPHIDVLKSYSIKSIPTRLFGLFEPYNALWNNSGLPKPKFHIKNITFMPSDWSIIGKNKRTLKLHKEGIDIMIFNCLKKDKEDLQLGYYSQGNFVYEPQKDKLIIDVIGILSINIYNNKKINQIIVENFNIKKYEQKGIENLW